MNKKQLRKLIEESIQFADEQDVKSGRQLHSEQRQCDRLNSFVAALRGSLNGEHPELAELLAKFQRSVIYGENPLLGAADGDKEPK